MSAIDFIAADMSRQKRAPRYWAMAAAGLALAMAAIGLGARRDWVDAFRVANLWPPLLILALLGALPFLRKNLAWLAALGLILALSLVQPQTGASLAKFDVPARFWPENLHCLALGLAASLLASIALTLFVSRWLPAPTRRIQLTCALMSGVAGLAALTFHCMGPLWSHIAIAHWGQAALIFPVAYLEQRALFARRVRRALAPGSALQNLDRLS